MQFFLPRLLTERVQAKWASIKMEMMALKSFYGSRLSSPGASLGKGGRLGGGLGVMANFHLCPYN